MKLYFYLLEPIEKGPKDPYISGYRLSVWIRITTWLGYISLNMCKENNKKLPLKHGRILPKSLEPQSYVVFPSWGLRSPQEDLLRSHYKHFLLKILKPHYFEEGFVNGRVWACSIGILFIMNIVSNYLIFTKSVYEYFCRRQHGGTESKSALAPILAQRGLLRVENREKWCDTYWLT